MDLRISTPGEILGESLEVHEGTWELGDLSVPQAMLTLEGTDPRWVRGGVEEMGASKTGKVLSPLVIRFMF